MKYKIDATIMITLEDVSVNLDQPANEELEFQDALIEKLRKKLVLLDLKGGRSGEDGFISAIECESIDNWESQQ